MSDGRAAGTPASTLLLPSFSLSFICSQFSITCCEVFAFCIPPAASSLSSSGTYGRGFGSGLPTCEG